MVILENGDRITGEVKNLERGKLTFKTDWMGTLLIEWESIVQIVSGQNLEVELETGEKYFGDLSAESGAGSLEIVGEESVGDLDLASVVRIAPIEEVFWKRLDGNISFGFSFTEADDRKQFSLNTETSYLSPKPLRTVSFETAQTSQPGVKETDRYDLTFEIIRFLKRPKNLLIGQTKLAGNDELGLERRVLGAPGQLEVLGGTRQGGLDEVHHGRFDGGEGQPHAAEAELGLDGLAALAVQPVGNMRSLVPALDGFLVEH